MKCNETGKCRGKVVVTFKFRGFAKVHCRRHWDSVSRHVLKDITNITRIS